MLISPLLVLLAFFCYLALFFLVARYASAGFFLFLLVFAIDCMLLEPPFIKVGLQLYPVDFLSLVLFPAGVYRLLALGKMRNVPLVWWAIGAVHALLFVLGLSKYGSAAGVEYRGNFCFWAGSVYVASFEYSEKYTRNVLRWLLVMGMVGCLASGYRWVLAAFDVSFRQSLEQLDPNNATLLFARVEQSNVTMLVALAAITAFFYSNSGRRTRIGPLAVAMVFGIIVLLMQHRSVWVATLVGFLSLIIAMSRRRGGRASGSAVKFLLLGAVVIGGLAGGGGTVSQSIQSQAEAGSDLKTGTFGGRVFSWQQLLGGWATSGSPVTYSVGYPFGTGFERYDREDATETVSYAPHNMYVWMLLRGGVIGLSCLVLFLLAGLRDAWRRSLDGQDRYAPLVFAMLAALIFYFIPYGADYSQMLVFGLLSGLIRVEKVRQQRAKRSPVPDAEVLAQ